MSPNEFARNFRMLRKCHNKLDCLIFEMLFIKELKPTVNRVIPSALNYLSSVLLSLHHHHHHHHHLLLLLLLLLLTITSCPSFGKKNCQVEHYFPANFLCRVMKRQLSTALGLVSRLFALILIASLNFKLRT